ncbi:MAG: TIR domain-containing protein [Byssovorax sp.]
MPPPPDLFLAHAGADTRVAEQLFDLLLPDVRPWLDSRDLLPGDEWPKEIPRAQRAALATVILLSPRADHAYYLSDEIHTAIALHRADPDAHRAVTVFLEGRPADPTLIPYGLRTLHHLDAVAEGGMAGVAARLKGLVTALRARAGGVAAPTPAGTDDRVARPSGGQGTMSDANRFYELLCKLTMGGQIEGVILRAGLPRHQIAPSTASVQQRALDIAQIVAADDTLAMAARVAGCDRRGAVACRGGCAGGGIARPAAAGSTAGACGASLRPRPSAVQVLLVFANPRGTDRLRLDAEERVLRESIQLAAHRDRLEIEALHAATIDDLRRALSAKPRTIVHFSGHGEEGGLLFEDEKGITFVPDLPALASLLRYRGVETVVLNACYSTRLAEQNPMGTRYTVAMEGQAKDKGAIEFSRGFYDIIGAGRGVEEAYREGLMCAALKGMPVKAKLLES